MKANETWTAILDPQYSVLPLPRGLGRDGARYLDIVTGWQGSRRNRHAFERRRRRHRLKYVERPVEETR
jgi:hypothetical protein